MSIAREIAGRSTPARRAKQSQTAPSATVQDDVLRFSNGDISRAQAMRALRIGYSELLDRIVSRALPLPKVDDAEADRMAGVVVALMAAGSGLSFLFPMPGRSSASDVLTSWACF